MTTRQNQNKVQGVEQPADLATMAAQVAYHTDQAAEHTAAAKLLKEKIAAEIGEFKTVPAGEFVITYTAPKRTFSEPAFIKAYPPDTNGHMYKQIPARTELDKDMVPPKLKDRFMVPGTGTGTVTIK